MPGTSDLLLASPAAVAAGAVNALAGGGTLAGTVKPATLGRVVARAGVAIAIVTFVRG